MNSKYNPQLLDCTEQMINELIQFGQLYYDKASLNLNKEYLKWLYIDNPNGQAKVCIIKNENMIVGVIIFIPIYLGCTEFIQKAYFAMNVLTHPQYRGQNLFGLMIAHSKDFFSKEGYWLLGHPNKNAIKGWARAKMQFRRPLKVYLSKFSLLSLFGKIGSSTLIKNNEDLKNIPDEFWRKVSKSYNSIHVLFSHEFISWRFINAIEKGYKVKLIKKDSETIGLLISKKYKFGFDLLIDVIAEPTNVITVMKYLRVPTLILRAEYGGINELWGTSCWKLPFKKELPFFVSNWVESIDFDCSCISLASGDF